MVLARLKLCSWRGNSSSAPSFLRPLMGRLSFHIPVSWIYSVLRISFRPKLLLLLLVLEDYFSFSYMFCFQRSFWLQWTPLAGLTITALLLPFGSLGVFRIFWCCACVLYISTSSIVRLWKFIGSNSFSGAMVISKIFWLCCFVLAWFCWWWFLFFWFFFIFTVTYLI